MSPVILNKHKKLAMPAPNNNDAVEPQISNKFEDQIMKEEFQLQPPLVAALEVMLPEITDERPRDSKYQNKQKEKKAHKRTLVDGKISDYIRAIERHLKNLNLEGEEKLAH